MKDIETRLRDMADKWHDANQEVFNVCRDGAEEIRVLRTELNLLKKFEKEKYSYYSSNFSLGWGKGKDE